MPLFEFSCKSCSQSFEELLRSSDAIAEVTCPVCGGHEVNKKVSRIAARPGVTSGFTFNTSAASSCSSGST